MSASGKRLQKRVAERREAKRRIELSRQENPPPIVDADEIPDRFTKQGRRRKFVLGVLLVPVCIIGSITFVELFFNDTVRGAFWKQEGFWFFATGCLFWLSLGWAGIRPKLPYVFAHEVTHMITAKLSGGKIHDWDVTEDGGFVETDKTGTFITLSPYLIPLYTLIVFAAYGIAAIFTNLHEPHLWHFFSWGFVFKWAWLFYMLVGATWCFHMTFTLEILRTEQSDLLHNGEFFSIIVIFLGNLTLLGLLFIAASPTVGWRHVWGDARDMVLTVWHWIF